METTETTETTETQEQLDTANMIAPKTPRARRFLAVAPWPRALVETVALAGIIAAMLPLYPGQNTELNLLLAFMLLIGPAGCALWLAEEHRHASRQSVDVSWLVEIPGDSIDDDVPWPAERRRHRGGALRGGFDQNASEALRSRRQQE